MRYSSGVFSPVATHSNAQFALENLVKDSSGAVPFFFLQEFFVFFLSSH